MKNKYVKQILTLLLALSFVMYLPLLTAADVAALEEVVIFYDDCEDGSSSWTHSTGSPCSSSFFENGGNTCYTLSGFNAADLVSKYKSAGSTTGYTPRIQYDIANLQLKEGGVYKLSYRYNYYDNENGAASLSTLSGHASLLNVSSAINSSGSFSGTAKKQFGEYTSFTAGDDGWREVSYEFTTSEIPDGGSKLNNIQIQLKGLNSTSSLFDTKLKALSAEYSDTEELKAAFDTYLKSHDYRPAADDIKLTVMAEPVTVSVSASNAAVKVNGVKTNTSVKAAKGYTTVIRAIADEGYEVTEITVDGIPQTISADGLVSVVLNADSEVNVKTEKGLEDVVVFYDDAEDENTSWTNYAPGNCGSDYFTIGENTAYGLCSFDAEAYVNTFINNGSTTSILPRVQYDAKNVKLENGGKYKLSYRYNYYDGQSDITGKNSHAALLNTSVSMTASGSFAGTSKTQFGEYTSFSEESDGWHYVSYEFAVSDAPEGGSALKNIQFQFKGLNSTGSTFDTVLKSLQATNTTGEAFTASFEDYLSQHDYRIVVDDIKLTKLAAAQSVTVSADNASVKVNGAVIDGTAKTLPGQTSVIKATADSGYYISKITVDGVDMGIKPGVSASVTAVLSEGSQVEIITAQADIFDVEFSVEGNGLVKVDGKNVQNGDILKVLSGFETTVEITPDSGYGVGAVAINGEAYSIQPSGGKFSYLFTGDSEVLVTFVDAETAGKAEFFVSADGDDSNPGTKDKPFATITAARDALRKLIAEKRLPEGEIYVNFRGGEYEFTETVNFTSADSAPEGITVVYRSYPGETAVFTGSEQIPYSKISKVTEADTDTYGNKILDRVTDPLAAEMLYKLDLGEYKDKIPALYEYGWSKPAGTPDSEWSSAYKPMDIFIGGELMNVARWPNDEEDYGMVDITGADTSDDFATTPSKVYYDDRNKETANWNVEAAKKDMLVFAYMGSHWCANAYKISDFDPSEKSFTVKYGTYGKPTADHPLFFLNMLEAIDKPGEYYIDRDTGILYFYALDEPGEDEDIKISVFESNMLNFEKTSNVKLENIEMKYTRETPLRINDTKGFEINGCVIAHGYMGASFYGSNILFKNNVVSQTGADGIQISGGNRNSLTSSGNVIENNLFIYNGRIKRTYSPAIYLNGTGNRIIGNEIAHNPHEMINIVGNDHEIAYNYFHHGCTEAGDMGAIYWGGMTTVKLGTKIHDNYFYRISNTYNNGWSQSIFGDDGTFGAEIYNNIFYQGTLTSERGGGDVSYPFKTYGGQYFNLSNNIFIDSPKSAVFKGWIGAGFENPRQGQWVRRLNGYEPAEITDGVAKFPKSDSRTNWSTMFAPYVDNEAWIEKYENTIWEPFFDIFSSERHAALEEIVASDNYEAEEKYDFYDHDRLAAYIKNYAPEKTNVYDNNLHVKIKHSGGIELTGNEVVTNCYSTNDTGIFVDFENQNFELTADGLAKVKAGGASGFENISMKEMGTDGKVGNSDAPAVSDASLSGTGLAGEVLTLVYTFSDSDGDKESGTEISWWSSRTVNGTYDRIVSEGDDKLIITDELKGRYVKAIVTPFDETGRYGESVETQSIYISYDITAANERIAGVEALIDAAVIGTEPGNYPESAVADLKAAVETAKTAVLEAKSQDAVEDAIKALERAVTVFGNRKVKDTSTDDEDSTATPSVPSYGGGSSGGGGGGGSSSAGNKATYDGSISNTNPVEPSATPEEFCFDDMVNHWAKTDVMNMYKAGIISGVTDKTFEPDRGITRAEFATLIAKALKLEENKADFEDVKDDDWFAPFVGAAAKAGIIVGSDGNFRPNDTITREEMAVIIVKAYEYSGKTAEETELDFTDNDSISDWAKPFVSKAVGAGLISGMGDGAFAPSSSATRAQSASVITRILK